MLRVESELGVELGLGVGSELGHGTGPNQRISFSKLVCYYYQGVSFDYPFLTLVIYFLLYLSNSHDVCNAHIISLI